MRIQGEEVKCPSCNRKCSGLPQREAGLGETERKKGPQEVGNQMKFSAGWNLESLFREKYLAVYPGTICQGPTVLFLNQN